MLAQVRALDGLTEKSPGVFYRRSNAFLHFHVDGDDLYADLKVGGDFERYRVTTVKERRTLVAAARRVLRGDETSLRGGAF